MTDIRFALSVDLAKKILGNSSRANEYLLRLNKVKPIKDFDVRTVSRGINRGQKRVNLNSKDLWQTIAETWNYDISKQIIRDIFKETDKYLNGQEADKSMAILIGEWQKLNLGKIAWPFSQGAFDEFVQRINSESQNGSIKDEKVHLAAIKYRRIKEINTVRNDFIETLIFEKNNNILPTLNHRRGVDFFINGISYDQKVAKSPTNEFKRKFKDNWRQTAINNPKLVAEYLYKYQDEGRFGADPRLLVVYLDSDVSIDQIRQTINNTDLNKPFEVNFTFNHKLQGEIKYQVPCFVILLHN